MKRVPLLLLAILVATFISCDKNIGVDGTKTGQDDENIIKIGEDNYFPLGVPVVMPNDNFVMTFAMDALDEGVKIYCFDKSGKKVWDAELPENPANPVFHNGQLLFACRSYIYAIDAGDGSQNWKYQVTGEGMLATKNTYKPCIASDGSIIVCMDSYLSDISTAVPAKIVSLSASGGKNWEQAIPADDNYYDRFTKLTAPLATPKGVYCIAHISGANGNSALLNKYAVANGQVVSGPVVYDEYQGCKLHCANNNGDIFMSGNDDTNFETRFFAFTSGLTEKWSVSFGNNYVANLAVIDKDGNIFIGVEDGYFHKYTPSGNELFSANLQQIFVRGEMLIAADGNIYKCLQGAEKLDPQTGKSTSIPINGLGLSDLSVLSDGTLVYAGMGEVYMVPTSANGFSAGAQWPSYGFDGGNSSFKD